MKRRSQFYDKILDNFHILSGEEKKLIFQRLYENFNSLNLIFENLDEGVIAIDKKGIVQGINKKAYFLFGIQKECDGETMETAFKNLHFGNDILELLKNNSLIENVFLNDEKNERILSINILPLGEQGEIKGKLIKILDITAGYEQEQKLKRAEQLASLTTLAASVAHEIKNPLGSISIYIQLIEKSILRSGLSSEVFFNDIKGYCDIVKEEVSRLEDTINSFLFSVRNIELNKKKIKLKGVILSTIDFLKYEIEQNGISVTIDFEDDNLILDIDEKYIKQAIINIIKNSIDAMKETDDKIVKKDGTDKNNKEKKHIIISVKTNEKDALISVKDTGIGIKKEVLKRMFEPYFTTKANGTGLGLTNVLRIAEAHQGSVLMTSEYGIGSEVTIKLPLINTNQKYLLSGE